VSSETIELLRGQQSIAEVLETAMGFEATARDFYQALVDRVSKPIRELVAELAEEEKRHYELFQELAARPDVRAHIGDQIAQPPSDHRFSNYIQRPELSDFPDEQSILQYALSREQAAMEQYQFLATQDLPEPLHEVFTFLAQEELQHKAELEKRYYDLIFTTNV